MKTSPRLTVLVLATLALSASACRPPVFFPQFGVETGSDPINFAEDSAIQPDGEFVVTWRGFGAKDVYGRRFSSLTSPLGPPFAMNADTAPLREGASIDRDASGRYVIVWKENDADIWGQRWNADGTPIGGNFQINFEGKTSKQTTTLNTQGLLMEGLRILDESKRDDGPTEEEEEDVLLDS